MEGLVFRKGFSCMLCDSCVIRGGSWGLGFKLGTLVSTDSTTKPCHQPSSDCLKLVLSQYRAEKPRHGSPSVTYLFIGLKQQRFEFHISESQDTQVKVQQVCCGKGPDF